MSVQTPATPAKARADAAVRSFHVEIPQAEIDELRRRVRATRWPDKETISDRSQGGQLAKLRPLVEYWGSDYAERRSS